MADTVAGLAATAAEQWDAAEIHLARGIAHAERIGHRFAFPAHVSPMPKCSLPVPLRATLSALPCFYVRRWANIGPWA